MKLFRVLYYGVAGAVVAVTGLLAQSANPTNPVVASAPVYVPDISHASGPLPDGALVWNTLTATTNVAAGQPAAQFTFNFTNIAKKIEIGLATNVTILTNITTVTNSSFWARLRGKSMTQVTNISQSTSTVPVTNDVPIPVTILSVHPSCGCTTAQLPPLPWTIAPGTNGQIGLTVNLAGKSGTLFKSVNVATDKGSKDLYLRITILPPPPPVPMSEEERAKGVAAARIDRQVVFKGDCASCHAKPAEGKYGKALYDAVCAICHEAEHRAEMVPDLHNLTVPTNDEFWRTWIAHGKAGSLMPAFATAEGGPLNDMQIASIAAYLNFAMPSRVPPPPPTNAPPAK